MQIFRQNTPFDSMTLKDLQCYFPRDGKIEYISIRPTRVEAVIPLEAVQALKDIGLEGDHYNNRGGRRQVTFIQAEHLNVIAALLNQDVIPPGSTRRNIVVSGLNLLALKGKQFKIGEAVFEYSGDCHPCSRMEQDIGTGAYNAMRGHGGITAKVVRTGLIKIGDSVCGLHTNTER